MSLFSEFIHVVFGGHQYSTSYKYISREEINQLVSQNKVSSLSQHEVKLIEESIAAGRTSEGKISISKIDEVLKKLENTKKISEFDRKGVIKVFQSYLGSR